MTEGTQSSPLTSSFSANSANKEEVSGGLGGWAVREAVVGDAPAVAEAVAELLVELSGGGPPPAKLEQATRELAGDGEMGALLVAEAGGEDGIIGVLAASWQHAIHVPGRYATIQDLWVHPDWRSKAVGRELVEAFCELARAAGAKRIEVGLPRESFERIAATEAFYRSNGFAHLGPRMRRKL